MNLKIFDGVPTLTTHVNHLLFTQYTQILTYNIVHQTTHLHEARVNDKVVLAAVVHISYSTTRGGSHVKSNNYVSRTPVVVTFLARSCFTSTGMHIPSETRVIILTLYTQLCIITPCHLKKQQLYNLLYQNPCLFNLSVSSL